MVNFGVFVLQIFLTCALKITIAVLNCLCFLVDKIFQSKIKLNPTKQIVVITGCDSGFGEMLSIRLSHLGWQVVSGCLLDESVSKLAGKVALALKCDITKCEDIENLALQTRKFSDSNNLKLWAVVNNAGIADSGAIDWLSMDTLRKVMEVNFFGAVGVTKAMLPLLKANPGSRIINISSVAGFLSSPIMGAYNASKHAVEGINKALRQELRHWDIWVCNVNPGFMRTPMVLEGKRIAMSRFNELPDEVRRQYQPDFMGDTDKLHGLLEDPAVVVDEILEAITDARPGMWYFPGLQAQVLRHLCDANGSLLDLVARGVPSPHPTQAALASHRT